MNLINFLIANWDSVLLILVVIAAIIYICFRGGKSVVFKMLYAMVTEAEKTYGGGTGSLKLATVIENLYPKLPIVVRLFVTANTLQNWVETVLTEAKSIWEKNSEIAAYIEENKT